jgi:hypothetical protein
VAIIKSTKFAHPTKSFWMSGIAASTAMDRQNVPKAVQFAVFGQEVLAA